jgi:hypothetical protein
MKSVLSLSVLASAIFASGAVQAADIESGLQVGEYPGAFNVADVTGPSAGQKLCYRCRYGSQPVVSIFARKIDDNVTKLVKEIDGVVGKHRDERMAAFVVLLTDSPDDAEGQLKKVASDNKIGHTPLTVFENTVGPAKYKINKDADVTVMMWVESDVKVNHAFAADALNADAISKVVSDTQKILN